MDRRKFIKDSCLICAGVSLASLLPGCKGIYYAQNVVESNRLIINKKEFEYLKKEELKHREFVLVEQVGGAPIFLKQLENNSFSAQLMWCTHQGCELTPQGKVLVCPCHNSEFSQEGEVLSGPAETNLKSFKTTQDEENIYIWL